MLRWEEKEDIDERMAQVEAVCELWRLRRDQIPEAVRKEFDQKLLISWIYHDAALEGEVLTYSEIKAATDSNIISDITLIPAYEEIKAFNQACHFALEYADSKKPVNVDLFRQVYGLLIPEEDAKGAPYRKDNPLHRLYYHEIAPPDKIGYRMRKLDEWIESGDAGDHPIERAVQLHHKFMAIFPWAKHSGRTARVVSNLMLIRAGYPLAIIHAIDRQRYYESLRNEDDKLLLLYLESVETTAQSAIRVFEEAAASIHRRRRAS